MFTSEAINFPPQKMPISKKTREWRKMCVDASESLILRRHTGLRQTIYNKTVNYNLYSDILDQADVEKLTNPFKLKGLSSMDKMQNYPIANPKIDLLYGECLNRKFDFQARIINEDAISEKEQGLKDKLKQMIINSIKDENLSDEDMQARLKKFEAFRNYEYQDLREKRATQILKHLYKKLRLEQKFAKGFKDALICAEELYHTDIIAGEPTFEKLNPKNVHIIRSGYSPYVEDADVIMIEHWYSPGRCIDEYHDELTPEQIDMIEHMSFTGGNSKDINIGEKKPVKLDFSRIDANFFESGTSFTKNLDTEGNIRVLKVYWKSRRKMLKVTSFDEFGDEVVNLEDETYSINKELGESSKPIWINEWWEGHKLGGTLNTRDQSAIYVRMRPRPVQFRSMENPSKCHPGIVGTIYQTNDNSASSLMDRMKPYQYMYNILMKKTEEAVAKNHGKIMALDLAKIPEHWKLDQWMSFAQTMNLAVYDSFKEGSKGAAMGKLAGANQAMTPVIDLEMGNTIQLYISMMQYIKDELGEIAGVTKARQGQISTKEAVGNTQRAVLQSSQITEYWFAEHEFTRIRAIEALLETAKYAWKDKKNKKVQFILDDGSTQMFDIDGQQFNEIDYDICITTGSMTDNMREQLQQMAHAGLQNGLIKFSQLMDIMTTESVASIRRKIEQAERDTQEQNQQSAKAERDSQEKIAQLSHDLEIKKQQSDNDRHTQEMEMEERKLENNIILKQMDMSNKADKVGEAVDVITLESLRHQADKIKKDHEIKLRQVIETERSNKEKEKIAKSKNNK